MNNIFENIETFKQEIEKLTKTKLGKLDEERKFQLEKELFAFQSKPEYLLFYEDLVKNNIKFETNKNNLLIPYILGITNVNPIIENQEPHLWIQEGDSPDIDSDCEDRDRVFELLQEVFESDGIKRVVPITNFNSFSIKVALKDAARLHDISFEDVNMITKLIPNKIENEEGEEVETKNLSLEFLETKIPELKEFLEKHPALYRDVKAYMGNFRASSRHAGGVVLADNIDMIAPMFRSKGIVQTGFTDGISSRAGADMGFIKFDLLGLGTLRIISDCIHEIIYNSPEKWFVKIQEMANLPLEIEGVTNPFLISAGEFSFITDIAARKHRFKFIKTFYNNILSPSSINFDDKNVFKNVYQEGRFVGVFQMESEGMRRATKSFFPNRIEDIFAAVAIYRPGPLAGGVDKLYAENKKKAESGHKVSDHPILDQIFEPTYGLLIYQEQLMEVCAKMGKMHMKDVQKFRKVTAKKALDKEKEFAEKVHKQFLQGCEENDYPKNKAEELWNKMIAFSQYAFNSAHSVAYGMTSYITAWLLTYHKYEWYTAVLNNSKKEDLEKNILEISADGVKIGPPDIFNSGSRWSFTKTDKIIKFGLADIKGVGLKAAQSIINARKIKPFDKEDVFSFFSNENISWRLVNKSKVDVLIKSGAFDTYESDILRYFGNYNCFSKTISNHREFYVEHGKEATDILKYKQEEYAEYLKLIEARDSGEIDPKTKIKRVKKIETFFNVPEFSKKEKIQNYIKFLNFIPVSDSIKNFLNFANDLKVKSIDEHIKHKGISQPVWFRVVGVETRLTKNGKEHLVITGLGKNTVEKIKCWQPELFDADISDFVVAYLEYDPQWGFSTQRKKNIFKYDSI